MYSQLENVTSPATSETDEKQKLHHHLLYEEMVIVRSNKLLLVWNKILSFCDYLQDLILLLVIVLVSKSEEVYNFKNATTQSNIFQKSDIIGESREKLKIITGFLIAEL
jgi:hypothetical protein